MSLLDKSSDVWRRIYGQYNAVLKAKSETVKDAKKRKDLLSLDKWYQQELPTVIGGRSDKYVTHEELAKLMRWKLMRGKFRPRLQQMVEENSAESVETASRKAFKALPNLRQAVDALVVLRAVGPATASAVLAAGAPQYAPFMADESMLALPGLQPLKYTLPAYLDYAQQVSDLTKALKKQDATFGWSPHHVELALWSLQIAKTLKIDDTLSLLSNNIITKEPVKKLKNGKAPSATEAVGASSSVGSKRKKPSDEVPSKKKKV